MFAAIPIYTLILKGSVPLQIWNNLNFKTLCKIKLGKYDIKTNDK